MAKTTSIPMYDVVAGPDRELVDGPLPYAEAVRAMRGVELERLAQIDEHLELDGRMCFDTPEECADAVAWATACVRWAFTVTPDEYRVMMNAELAGRLQ